MNPLRYSLNTDFGIDNGQLDGKSAQECFVLGVEWRLFYEWLSLGASGLFMAHTANAVRLTTLGEAAGFCVTSMRGKSSNWTMLRLIRKKETT